MSMYLSTEQRGRVKIARVLWEKVSAREAEILEPELMQALASAPPPPRLVVDLSAVTMLASAGLGLLITTHKKTKESAGGGKMVVSGLSPAILEVMKLTKLHTFLTIEETVDDAVKRLG